MTQREARFQRLKALRERQHVISAAEMISVRTQLDFVRQQIEHHREASRMTMLQPGQVPTQSSHLEWLLSCAASRIHTLHAVRKEEECKLLETTFNDAQTKERSARLQVRQLESLLQRIQQEERLAEDREEQKVLDAAGNVRRASAAATHVRL